MRSGKAPSHIPLPPKPTLHDVFSSSALVSDPTASSDIMTSDEITSPTDSPIRSTSQDRSGDGTDVDGRRKSRSYSYRVGKGRNSIASGSGRRMSRSSWADSMGGTRRALFSPNYGHDRTENEGDEVKPAIPSLAVGIRPAYSTPLPLLPMMVLCIVSQLRNGVWTNLRECADEAAAGYDRLCSVNSYPRTHQHLSS